MDNSVKIGNELYRKAIHLFSSAVPISYFYFDRNTELLILSILSAAMLAVDIARKYSQGFHDFYDRVLGNILRHHETREGGFSYTGGTYIVLAFLLCVLVFPKPVAITSMFIVIIADSMAALVGMVFGRHIIRKGKSVEGSVAFFLTGILIVLFSPKLTEYAVEFYIAVVAVVVTTFIELVPTKIDDNVIIPLSFGIVYLALVKIILN